MNKKKRLNFKMLRSICNVPYIGLVKPVLPQNVVPSVKEFLQVVLKFQRVDKLPIAQSISKVTDSLYCMTLPGYQFKTKFHIIRQIKNIVIKWQNLQRNNKRNSETYLKQRNAFMKLIENKLDCVKPMSNGMDTNRKRSYVNFMLDDPGSCEPDENQSPEPAPKRVRKQNIISPNVAAALERTGTSNRNASIIIKALIHDNHMKMKQESSYSISHKTIRLTRQNQMKQKAMEIKQDFTPNVPLTVHWDGKMIPNNVSGKKEDRLPILVTGEGISKLLAVPALPNGTAAVEAEAIMQAIHDWNLSDKIVAMSFDTTNTNSGCRNGVITRLPAMLGKKLLSLACRHHVAELVLKHCFEINGDTSQSDKLDKFKRFQEEYNGKMDSGEKLKHRNVTTVPLLDKLTSPWRQNAIEFCLQQLTERHPRGDYVELLELVVLFLGGNTREEIKFKRAGSISRARWMARAIYVLKMWLLNDHFGNFDADLMKHYEILCIFISKIYVQYWFSLNNPITAPRIDIEFWRSISNFDFADFAKTGAKAFEKHLWYLSTQNIALAFFDDTVTSQEKDAMKEVYFSTIVAVSKRISNRKGKKPETTKTKASSIRPSDTLATFITTNTKEFFKIMKISTDFMRKPANEWSKDKSYLNAKQRVASLVVVNDVAERGVKLISDFNNKSTRDPVQQQYLLQVIEQHRKQHPMKS